MRKFLIFIFFLMLIAPPQSAGEKLLYAIRYGGPAKSPFKFKQISTQIFSLDPDNRENKLVFSDENTPIALSERPNVEGQIFTSKNRLYAFSKTRTIEIGHDSSWRPFYYYRFGRTHSIYEVFLDGTNRFRKVSDVIGTQYPRMMIIDPADNRISYLNYADKACKKPTLYTHGTTSGRLYNKIELAEIFLDCFATNIGWLPEGERLFFTLDTGDVHVTSEESYQRVGTYVMKENGTDTRLLSSSLFSFPSKKGFSGGIQPRCIGARPDGTLIIRDVKHKRGSKGGTCSFLYLVDPDSKSKKEIPMKVFEGLKNFKVSHNGRKVAFIQDFYKDTSVYIWIKDLMTGEENKVFSYPIRQLKGYSLGLAGWIVD